MLGGYSLRVFLYEQKRHYYLNMTDLFVDCNYESWTYYQIEKAVDQIKSKEFQADVFLLAVSSQTKNDIQRLLELKQANPAIKNAPVILIVNPSD